VAGLMRRPRLLLMVLPMAGLMRRPRASAAALLMRLRRLLKSRKRPKQEAKQPPPRCRLSEACSSCLLRGCMAHQMWGPSVRPVKLQLPLTLRMMPALMGEMQSRLSIRLVTLLTTTADSLRRRLFSILIVDLPVMPAQALPEACLCLRPV
jgi:hypothetical protein